MQKWMIAVVSTVALSGCAQLTDYASAVKTPPPAELVGNWQTFGPQSGLVSDQAKASLIISAAGDTLDCRQWQRVIAKPGKVTHFKGDWVNVNQQLRIMPLELEDGKLHYDKLELQKVAQPTAECQQALEKQAQSATQPAATPVTADAAAAQPTKPKMTYTQK